MILEIGKRNRLEQFNPHVGLAQARIIQCRSIAFRCMQGNAKKYNMREASIDRAVFESAQMSVFET